MSEWRHPRALDSVSGHPPHAVTLGGETVDVTDGTFEAEERDVTALADAYGVSLDELRVGTSETNGTLQRPHEELQALMAAGECPWCNEYSGDHIGQHASSAHPDKWAAFKDD